MNHHWNNIIHQLDYAFQPIIHTHTGKIYAVEALLRNVQTAAGVSSISDIFDRAFEENTLYHLDIELRYKAIEKFSHIKIEDLKLFYNLDNRIIYHNSNMPSGNTSKILEQFNLKKSTIYFELSEKGTTIEQGAISSMLNKYKTSGYNIAIDDFGIGVSGLKLLYFSEANIIKIDRYFITNIEHDSKKKLFCSSIVDMAHIMGMKVVAEGVESANEFYTCKAIGIDFIQGYLIQKPTTNINEIKPAYNSAIELIQNDRRNNSSNIIDQGHIQFIEPLHIATSLHDLFIYFKENPKNTFVPIIDDHHHIQGVIYEVDIKQISYSQYGLSLAKNLSYSSNLKKFIQPALSIEKSWGIDKTLEMYNMSKENSKGIFVTNANRYCGFIDVNALLSLSYKRNLEIAKNQNPLTKLPGNAQIEEFIFNAFRDINDHHSHMLYFDFNDFKPFNDTYGFRQGDRAILIFSELLQKYSPFNSFIAHIGGDDFFVGLKSKSFEEVFALADTLQNEFSQNVRILYSKEDQRNDYIIAHDRFNERRKFSLLTTSCAILELTSHSKKEDFDYVIGKIKKASKKSKEPISTCM